MKENRGIRKEGGWKGGIMRHRIIVLKLKSSHLATYSVNERMLPGKC